MPPNTCPWLSMIWFWFYSPPALSLGYGPNCAHPPTPNPYVEALTPNENEFGDRAFRSLLRLNEIIRVAPNPIGLVLLQEEEETPRACTKRERGHARTQGERSHLQAKERPRESPELRPLDLGLPASRTVKK